MTHFSNVLMFVVSLIGFITGIILSVISPEELRPGKKYFVFLRRVLLSVIFIVSLVLMAYHQRYYLLLAPALYLLLYFGVLRFFKKYFYLKELVTYIYFILIFIFLFDINEYISKLIFLSLFFLYGLPAGSLFRLEVIRKHERKHEVKIKKA